ncbi:MAG: 2OG-Fe(II) oxygenase [Oligoflexia bacterium]|nr:2OG-Fe(II) oxygenase [Oligoflexia bacterium]
MQKGFLTIDQFFSKADRLRKTFEQKFTNPKESRSDQFVWNYWYVKNQYKLIRTPARYFFTQQDYEDFLSALGDWAWKTLGCSAITDPWLSYYIEGCSQEWHSDVPHGPFAFVYSLSPKSLKFKGGETLLLKPKTLNFWQNFKNQTQHEKDEFVQSISPKFNRLVVFDPRIPHSVSEVRGVSDPLEARLVLHGWFTEPKPFVEGPLKAKDIELPLNSLTDAIAQFVLGQEIDGILSIRMQVAVSGKVTKVEILANTLVDLRSAQPLPSLVRFIRQEARKLIFPKSKRLSQITLPLLFR